MVGEDKINWPDVFAFCETKAGTQWYVLEHESGSDPPSAVRRSYEALKKFGKA